MQDQENSKNQTGRETFPASPEQNTHNDDYRRDGNQLGSEHTEFANSTQQGGGGTGYDVNREQHEVNKEQEQMHQERDLEQVQPEKAGNPQPDITPGKEQPTTEPGKSTPAQPQTNPGTGSGANTLRSQSNAWSQSSWDANAFH